MCSSTFSLRGPGGYNRTTLADHLKVDRINLVVTGTGVSAIKAQCGSSPQHFVHVVVGKDIAQRVEAALRTKLTTCLPFFESFEALTKHLPKCRVLRQLDVVKKNARMHAFFVEAVEESFVFEHMKKEYPGRDRVLSGIDSTLHDKCFMLTMYTHCYAELKQCLSRALIRFKNVSGLGDADYTTVKQAVFRALLFSCMRRDWRGAPDRQLEAEYGILVDEARFREVATKIDDACGPTRDDDNVCLARYAYSTHDKVVLVEVPADMNHRYAVSPAHTELALSMLGTDDLEWTRLGFERIMTEALCLHTLIALHAADTLIALAITEFFEKRSVEEPRLGLQLAERVATLGVMNSRESALVETVTNSVLVGLNNISEDLKTAKRKVIKTSRNIEAEDRKMLLKLFDYLSAIPEDSQLTTDVLRLFDDDDKALEGMIGLLLNDEKRDPMRSMKVRRWADALRLRRKSKNVAVLKTTLPDPGKNFFEPVKVGDEGGKGGQVVQVVRSGWLLRELERRANEQLWHLFERKTNLELPVVVVAMMYQDAPGIDAVVGYGTCSRRQMAANEEEVPEVKDETAAPRVTRFKVDKLVKLQFKKRDSDETKRSVTVLDPSAGERLLLAVAGSTLSCKDDALDDLWTPKGVVMEHCLVQLFETETAHCTNVPDPASKRLSCWYVINKESTEEALHPTQWVENEEKVGNRHERVTQCVSMSA